MQFTEKKFRSLTKEQQHRKCAQILQKYVCQHNSINREEYGKFCLWIGIDCIHDWSFEQIEQRFHWHMRQTNKGVHEADFLSHLTTQDKDTAGPWLSVHTYLDGLQIGRAHV